MTELSRVVWREGMHLGQHHFQLQQRYFEDTISFAINQLFFKPYGVTLCTFDAEGLRNGFVSVVRGRGLLPDGTPFSFPDCDPAPAAVDVRDQFQATQRSHLIYLALPPLQRDSANVGNEENGVLGRRMHIVERNVRDETTGNESRPIEFGAKNLRVCLGPDLSANDVRLPIARIRSLGAGQFQLDETYIPPIVTLGASGPLLRLAQRIVDKLDAKSRALAAERIASGGNASAYAAHEVSGFWIQHAMNTSAVPLRHMLAVRSAHPEELFVELSSLAGALCTFIVGANPREIPLYDHDALDTCFGALERLINERLDWAKPTNFVRLALNRVTLPVHKSGTTGKTIAVDGYSAHVSDDRAYGRAHWVLAIRAAESPAALVSAVVDRVKACAADGVSFLVASAHSGFKLTHLAVPPATIPSTSGTQYFTITREGVCDDRLRRSRELGIYVPDSIQNPELELFIIYDS